jgi:hypothetical protein
MGFLRQSLLDRLNDDSQKVVEAALDMPGLVNKTDPHALFGILQQLVRGMSSLQKQ